MGHMGAGAAPQGPQPLPGVAHVVAVGSGKGGVGKTTVAVNLAVALGKLGYKVGLIDADIYGPNVPMMLGQTRQPNIVGDNRIGPHGGAWREVYFGGADLAGRQADGDARADAAPDHPAVSAAGGVGGAGFSDRRPAAGHGRRGDLAGADGAADWRGGGVDAERCVALQDARKALEMFHQVKVEVIGLVENMSQLTLPALQQVIDVFGAGGTERTAQQFGLEFLGAVELDPQIREGGDKGLPVSLAGAGFKLAKDFYEVAKKVAEKAKEIASKSEDVLEIS